MFKYKIIDAHCDTLSLMAHYAADLQEINNHISIEKLTKGNVCIQFFAAWTNPVDKPNSYLESGLKLIDTYNNMLDMYRHSLMPILHYEDAVNALHSEKIGCVLAVEGGEILEGELANLNLLYELGVRLMTLTWNYTNDLSSGIGDENNEDMGLSEFGRTVVYHMNKLGMLIDLSHISYRGFWDVCELSNMPVIASHSNSKTVCNHKRNLDDRQLEAIAKKEGIVGINFYPPFLSNDGVADITDIIRHIEYIAGLIGIDYIGFGSDFDGIGKVPQGIKGAQSYLNIIEELLKLNYKEEHIEKICNKNMLRVLKMTL